MPGFKVTVEGRDYRVDAPDPNTAWDWANQFHGEVKTKREAGVKQMQEEERTRFKTEEAKNPLNRLANLGAGFDTAWQGAKQLGKMAGIGPGVGDEELRDSRRMKGELAETTTGGGLLQLAGEVAPTAVLPMGATGGLSRALALGATGAAGGGVAGALQPVTSDESRLANVGFGAAGGAAAPLVVHGAAKMLPRALGGRGEGEVATRAGSRLVKALGGADEALETAGKLEAPRRSRLTRSIPLTAAETARSPELARVELAARRDAPEQFTELARRQNEAIHRAALRAGKEGTEETVSRAATARDLATAPMREEALGLASKFSHVSEPLQNNTAEILQRTAKGSAANRVASHVQGVLETNPNPAQLYDLRKDLVRRLSGPSQLGDDLSAAVKGADRETMTLVRAIDERLNEAASRTGNTGDLWTQYLDKYTGMSPQVTSARAQQQINQALTAEGRPLVGDAPETTRHVLKQAVDKFGKNKFGSRLTPEAQGRYSELTDFLAKKEEPMRSMKLGGTGGGGSQTAMQHAISVFTGHSLSPKLRAMHWILDRLSGPVQEEVTSMMLDPARAASGIRAALQASRPLSASEQAFLALSRSAGTAAPLALTGTE
jgi:hypothetical protein